MRRHRELKITLKPLPLISCVALGLWLGAMAIMFSLWLALQLWPDQLQPLAQVLAPRTATAIPGAGASSPAPPQQEEMFERYKAILEQQEAEQAAAAEGSPRHLDSPRCQFWLQQNRTAPTDKSQANVLQFCYRP